MIYCHYGCDWSWMWWPVKAKSELVKGALLLLVAFLLVNDLNFHLSLVLASVVQGDAVNCNKSKNEVKKIYLRQYNVALPLFAATVCWKQWWSLETWSRLETRFFESRSRMSQVSSRSRALSLETLHQLLFCGLARSSSLKNGFIK